MTKKQSRQQRVIERLEAQLKSGVKNENVVEGKTIVVKSVELTDKDTERIKKEIGILKTRI